MRISRRALLPAILLGLLLGACAAPSPAQIWQARSATLQVELSLDAAASGERQAAITISDRAGRPVEADAVILAPTMPGMGHSNPELAAERAAPGRYRVRGELFSMRGEWQVAVVVRRGSLSETVTFAIEIRS